MRLLTNARDQLTRLHCGIQPYVHGNENFSLEEINNRISNLGKNVINAMTGSDRINAWRGKGGGKVEWEKRVGPRDTEGEQSLKRETVSGP